MMPQHGLWTMAAAAFFLLSAFDAGSARADALSMNALREVLNVRPQGDAQVGAALFAATGCAGCHGEAGISANPEWPILAGQRSPYLYKMLLDYRAGRMQGQGAGMMAAVTANLNEQQISDLAEWLSRQTRPMLIRHTGREPAVLKGDRSRLIPPCEACHGANGQGWDLQPTLAGQHRAYLVSVLNRFKSGERNNDINAGMAQIARKLNEQEISALADYYGK
ncbi:c-type cytochrome [Candidatus Methylospira mobilis]|uniref:C-type cytochrome n=1 Tax=Candidatus Methylospira mobilis TaxID=1808979 RepID=A0A5Q0BNP4_9GAMM|nr:c-type cytochrome [Candidatus Methylospira mobilis]QFY43376.1 c-type cytochrome [Candidatus Methylospira mobilis]WNV03405.1 c-type cytochrome [Candidatus Methylospira mobilis]